MSIFKKLFGGGNSVPPPSEPTKEPAPSNKPVASINTIQFGRYTDCNKTKEQVKHWDQAKSNFEAKNYLAAFEEFLNYVRDAELENVTISKEADRIRFELIQGSQRITGECNNDLFKAEAKIAMMQTPNVAVMRKLMVINFGLNYSSFSLRDNTIMLRFSSHTVDASPNKLYAGLSELAKKADQQDDLLLSEFSFLEEIDSNHLEEKSPKHQEIQYEFLCDWIDETMNQINSWDQELMSGGISFLLLNLTYKIDYLICPQGVVTDKLERIQSLFFSKNNWTTSERNSKIIEQFNDLRALSKEQVFDGLYSVKCTFGIPKPVAHKDVMDMMFKEREKIAWYRNNGYSQVVEAVYGYMVSYAFFNYGMLYPVNELLNVIMQVLHPAYYAKMGAEASLVNEDGTLNHSTITALIQQIIKNGKSDYPGLALDIKRLKFNSKTDFIDSLLLEIDILDLRK